MAHLPVIADTFRCALNWSNGIGQTAENVIHIRTAASGATAQDVYTTMDAHVTATMWGPCSNQFAVESVSITPLDGSAASAQFFTGEPVKWTGAASGDQVPQVAGIIKLTTALRGRSFRGRVYLPAIAESKIANGAFPGTTMPDTATAWNAWNSAMIGATLGQQLVVASYKLAVATDVGGFRGELESGTQRRRQGRNRV